VKGLLWQGAVGVGEVRVCTAWRQLYTNVTLGGSGVLAVMHLAVIWGGLVDVGCFGRQ
jgi:hypothetical protein